MVFFCLESSIKNITLESGDLFKTLLQVYEKEKESTSSTIQLLNIRLNSLNEILRLQEQDISKVSY